MNTELREALKAWSSDVHGLADLYDIKFDGTDDDADRIEQLCEIIYQQIQSKPRKGANVDVVIKMIGSYLGDYIVSTIGGEWVENQGLPCVRIDRVVCYPLGKVHKRLTNGETENIVFYLKVLRQQLSDVDKVIPSQEGKLIDNSSLAKKKGFWGRILGR